MATFVGAVTWPLVVHAQRPAPPVIGFLASGSPEFDAVRVTAFRQGLNDTGFVEGRNVAINDTSPGRPSKLSVKQKAALKDIVEDRTWRWMVLCAGAAGIWFA